MQFPTPGDLLTLVQIVVTSAFMSPALAGRINSLPLNQLEKPSGFTSWVQEVASECESMHCVIHREMLASQEMTHELNNVWQDVIKMINRIKVCVFNSHLFTQLCEEMAAEHTCPLLYTEVRWLSKGRSLARVFEYESHSRDFF